MPGAPRGMAGRAGIAARCVPAVPPVVAGARRLRPVARVRDDRDGEDGGQASGDGRGARAIPLEHRDVGADRRAGAGRAARPPRGDEEEEGQRPRRRAQETERADEALAHERERHGGGDGGGRDEQEEPRGPARMRAPPREAPTCETGGHGVAEHPPGRDRQPEEDRVTARRHPVAVEDLVERAEAREPGVRAEVEPHEPEGDGKPRERDCERGRQRRARRGRTGGG